MDCSHLHRNLCVINNFIEQCAIRCSYIWSHGCARETWGDLKQNQARTGLHIKSHYLSLLVRCQLIEKLFLIEDVFEHKTLLVKGAQDLWRR